MSMVPSLRLTIARLGVLAGTPSNLVRLRLPARLMVLIESTLTEKIFSTASLIWSCSSGVHQEGVLARLVDQAVALFRNDGCKHDVARVFDGGCTHGILLVLCHCLVSNECFVGSLGEDNVIGNENVVGVQLVCVQNVNIREVAHGECGNIVGALDDDEQVLALGDTSQRCQCGAGGRPGAATSSATTWMRPLQARSKAPRSAAAIIFLGVRWL